MARIVGVDIPNEKRVVVSLTYIFGIGDSTAKKICAAAKVNEDIRVKNLTDDQLVALRGEVAKYRTEGDLRREVAMAEGKFVIVQTAPAVRAAIAEEFGHRIGEQNGTGKMVAALHRLGFSRVFDTNFAADLTIIEEAQELVNRIKSKGVLPQITSCSPGWINYMVDSSMYDRYSVGDTVKVIHGALEGTEGKIISIDKTTGACRVETLFFGRSTPVDVDFSEIEKI